MAFSPEVWNKVKADYEVHSMSINALSIKHKITRAAITTRSKKYEWVKGKTDNVISRKVIAEQELVEIKKETDGFSPLEAREVEKAVTFALEMADIYSSLELEIAKKTKEVVLAVDVEAPMASVNVKNLAQTLQVLKDKEKPTTQVNIQQNSTTMMTDKDLNMEIDRVLDQLADN